MKKVIFETKIYLHQDDAYEVQRIKDLIIRGNYAEAMSLARKFKPQNDCLKIEKLVLFTIDEVCEILKVFKRKMFEYIEKGQIQPIFLNDCQLYISLESLLEYLPSRN